MASFEIHPLTTMSASMDVDESKAIDESLYSRQLYVLGKEAMQKMAASNVLVCGLGGVGVEIAKNVALAGVKSLTLLDDTPATLRDLASQYYISEKDIGTPRAQACINDLAQLNSYVPVSTVRGNAVDLAASYQVVVLTEMNPELAVELNRACSAAGSKFVWAFSFGLVAALFNDFGEAHVVIDEDGEEPLTGVIAQIEANGEVLAPESAMHGLNDGQLISISDAEPAVLNGEYRVTVKGPLSFYIGALKAPYQSGGSWRQIKEPRVLKFQPLEEQLKAPEMLYTDFAKMERPAQLHIACLAVSAFKLKNNGNFPRPYNQEDATEVLQLAKNVAAEYKDVLGGAELDAKLITTFAKQASGDLGPVNAVIGSMAAQEILKAVSGKFTPVKQWMYFDAFEALPKDVTEADAAPCNSRYDPYYATFGKKFMEKLSNLRVFLVGAGAIGCEVLKNWALMGMGSGPKGHITVTDNDLIERSNLNRQFLFRPKDVGNAKSLTAAKAAAEMNPDIAGHFTALVDKVGEETEQIFNRSFWESLDLVTNALDNIEARTYVDSRCVYFLKPLIESGTLGTKGNVQVVVPRVTESYSSSHDPPEKSVPLCTLRSFPTKIDHTIAWAKSQFTELYEENPQNVNLYLTQPDYVESSLKKMPNPKGALDTIRSYLVNDRPLTFEQCIIWAVELFNKLYRNDILQLLHNFPADAKTASGDLFWAPPKRLPHAAELNLDDPIHFEFIRSAANLRAYNFGLKGDTDPSTFRPVVAQIEQSEFVPSTSVKIATNDEELSLDDGDSFSDLASAAAQLPSSSSLAGFRLNPAEFEKDDDSNFHIDFINAASNLRAINYRIEPVDRSHTKFIAGRIIPAIATTTALVTGLSTIEALKVVQGKTLEEFKNGFLNLALPFFTFSEPIASTKITFNKGESSVDKVWDRFTVDGNPTLGDLLKIFESKYGLTITMIAAKTSLLYADFQPPKKVQERMNMSMFDIFHEVAKITAPAENTSLTIEICADDREGEDVEDLPFVIINR